MEILSEIIKERIFKLLFCGLFMEIGKEKEKEYMKKIEAALFVAGRWLSLQDLIMLTDINPILVRKIIGKLKDRYSNEKTALNIMDNEDKWKMDVGEDYADVVKRLATGQSEFTKAEQETLAVIAYKQPVKQSIVVKIRGNKSYDHIKKFVELGLVKARKEGRTKELELSDEFYDYFHLSKKEEGN